MPSPPLTSSASSRAPKPLQAIAWFVRDYISRHRHPGNRALHVVGVPLAHFVSLYLVIRGRFAPASAAFVAGYMLQWAGHRMEGNEVGEWTLIKKITGRLR
jgi:hypothetical protein